MGIALLALAGFLLGGVWSMYRQGASKSIVGLLAAAAALAAVAGVMWS